MHTKRAVDLHFWKLAAVRRRQLESGSFSHGTVLFLVVNFRARSEPQKIFTQTGAMGK